MINGILMSKDIEIATIKDNTVSILNHRLEPLLLRRLNDIESWLENRVIDKHRPTSRILRKMLRLTTSSDLDVVLKFNAVSLTDTYWIKEEGSNMKWEDVKKCTDYFSELIINNKIDLYKDFENKRTFELTNVGSYEKCWKYNEETNDWYMIKRQSTEEVESEMIAYKVAKLLNIPVAEYKKLSDTLIQCKNFIHDWEYNFEDAYSIVDEEEGVEFNIHKFMNLKSSLVEEYIKMKILDCIIMNVDRHTRNYGILRDINTGEVISMAPMFDHNMCLTANKSVLKEESPKMYFDEIEDAINFSGTTITLPTLTKSHFQLSNDENINEFLWNNYSKILNIRGVKSIS